MPRRITPYTQGRHQCRTHAIEHDPASNNNDIMYAALRNCDLLSHGGEKKYPPVVLSDSNTVRSMTSMDKIVKDTPDTRPQRDAIALTPLEHDIKLQLR